MGGRRGEGELEEAASTDGRRETEDRAEGEFGMSGHGRRCIRKEEDELTARLISFSSFDWEKYIVLSSKPPSQDLFRFISSLHPPPHPSPLSIRGRLDVDFLRSPFVKHFRSFPPSRSSFFVIHINQLLHISLPPDISTPTPTTLFSQSISLSSSNSRRSSSAQHPALFVLSRKLSTNEELNIPVFVSPISSHGYQPRL